MNRIILVGVILMSLAGTACAGIIGGSDTWRYKMTLVIETPEGDKSGSAVREVKRVSRVALLPESRAQTYTVRGEAVAVDLGGRGVLFGLLTAPARGPDYGHAVFLKYFTQEKQQGVAIVEPNWYPQFVRFRELTDPMTVGQVVYSDAFKNSLVSFDPKRPVETFQESFGEGVRLKSVTIEVMEDAITWKIDEFLPWLRSVKMSYLNGGHTARDAPLGLDGGAFQRGEK